MRNVSPRGSLALDRVASSGADRATQRTRYPASAVGSQVDILIDQHRCLAPTHVIRLDKKRAEFVARRRLKSGREAWSLYVERPVEGADEQTFQRSRGHIAVLQVLFGFVPVALATVGAVIAWRNGRRILALTCLLALGVYPAFHLWTANFVSGQKHVVPGFLFGYLLAGVALERLWRAGFRVTIGILLALVTVWGGVQWYWQEHSWSDTRPLTRRLVQEMKRGERVIADSSWIYTLALYPAGLIESPADVIDANVSPPLDRRDACQITWLVGNLDTAESVRDGMERCGHRPVLSSMSRHYYFDTSRLRLDASTTTVTLYQADGPRQASIGADHPAHGSERGTR